jgi:hypothetical protein
VDRSCICHKFRHADPAGKKRPGNFEICVQCYKQVIDESMAGGTQAPPRAHALDHGAVVAETAGEVVGDKGVGGRKAGGSPETEAGTAEGGKPVLRPIDGEKEEVERGTGGGFENEVEADVHAVGERKAVSEGGKEEGKGAKKAIEDETDNGQDWDMNGEWKVPPLSEADKASWRADEHGRVPCVGEGCLRQGSGRALLAHVSYQGLHAMARLHQKARGFIPKAEAVILVSF